MRLVSKECVYFRSRANSQEPVRRRSQSKSSSSAANNNAMKRRSVGAFVANNDDDDGLDDVPDPFLAYKSFQQFKDSQGGYTATGSFSEKKLSDSLSNTKISSSTQFNKTPSSSMLNDSSLDNFDYKFSTTKLSDASRNSGIFSNSTPRYHSDFENASLNRKG